MSNSFYLTLPSNVDIPSFENKICDFTTYLPTSLHLTDHYEVALVEMTYTKSWYNIQSVPHLSLYDPARIIYAEKAENFYPGHYDSVENLVNCLNNTIKDVFFSEEIKQKLPILEYNSVSNKLIMKPGRSDLDLPTLISFGAEIDDMLGFTSFGDKHSNSELEIVRLPEFEVGGKSSSSVDIKAGVHSLMIYSDIVTPSIVGNAYANLLRSLPINDNAKFGGDCNITFTKPYYLPLASNVINKIQINIKDDNGRDIDFRFGRVTVTLHFRKKWRTII